MKHLPRSLTPLLCVIWGDLQAAAPPLVDSSGDTARQVIVAHGTQTEYVIEECSLFLVQHYRHLGAMFPYGPMEWDSLYGRPRSPLFNDLQADADHPAMPAAQYFGTKGFFAGYDAKLEERLWEALQTTWLEGFAQLQAGTLEPIRLTQRVRESEAVPSPATTQTRGDFLLQLWKKQNTPQ